MPFTEVFAELHLRREHSTAVDSELLLTAIGTPGPTGEAVRTALVEAVCGVLTALVALVDPQVVLLGGSWGGHHSVVPPVARRFGGLPRHVPVRPAGIGVEPSLTGARQHGLAELRRTVLDRPAASTTGPRRAQAKE